MLFETETGQTKAELSLRRERRNWDLRVDSITPMQKFEQYKQSQEFQLFGIGDNGKTVFSMNHDSRMGENVEEFVISADSCRKYKSYTFTCHAQTKGGYLVLGRTDGGVALYDAIMKSENASCVIDGYPGPVNSIDVAANGSMIAWTTPNFVFFTCPSPENWEKGHKAPKPKVLKLCIRPEDQTCARPPPQRRPPCERIRGQRRSHRTLARGQGAGPRQGSALCWVTLHGLRCVRAFACVYASVVGVTLCALLHAHLALNSYLGARCERACEFVRVRRSVFVSGCWRDGLITSGFA
uniref:Vacuolar import/degradation Vid27 C-terminal domain-containing protein n=1 Tax=Chrysotila carterae TaxID=13221 RepID=A0A7S4BL01_CHRCT